MVDSAKKKKKKKIIQFYFFYMWKQHMPKTLWYLVKKKKILPNAVQQVQTCFGNEGVSGVSAEGNSRLCNLL